MLDVHVLKRGTLFFVVVFLLLQDLELHLSNCRRTPCPHHRYK